MCKVVGIIETDPPTPVITIPETVTYAETAYQITEIGDGAFSNNQDITKVTLPANCKSIGESAFIGCILLSDINLNHVETIGAQAFSGCFDLSSVDLSSCTRIGAEAFSNCSNMQETVTIPEKLYKHR
ncbi:MAG: leucine-rich repeat domain-containing protein [Parabacteroides sp.]